MTQLKVKGSAKMFSVPGVASSPARPEEEGTHSVMLQHQKLAVIFCVLVSL